MRHLNKIIRKVVNAGTHFLEQLTNKYFLFNWKGKDVLLSQALK